MLKSAVFLLPVTTIKDCFSKAGFPFALRQNTDVEMECADISNFPGVTSEQFEEFVELEAGEPCTGLLADRKTLAEFLPDISAEINSGSNFEESELEEVEQPAPSTFEALKMIHSLRLHCSTLPEREHLLEKLDSIENSVEKGAKPKKQTVMTNFFGN